jgi:hypothetical protein
MRLIRRVDMKKSLLLVLGLCIFLISCHVPRPVLGTDTTQNELETMVALTEQAFTMQAIMTQLQPSFTPTNPVFPTATFTLTPEVTLTLESGFGSISGSIIGYPYGDIPRLSIVALSTTALGTYWYWITGMGNTYYSMDGYVSTGKYQVVAYDSSGHSGGCPTIVEVKNSEMVTCDITNWGGGYPAKPAGVP